MIVTAGVVVTKLTPADDITDHLLSKPGESDKAGGKPLSTASSLADEKTRSGTGRTRATGTEWKDQQENISTVPICRHPSWLRSRLSHIDVTIEWIVMRWTAHGETIDLQVAFRETANGKLHSKHIPFV